MITIIDYGMGNIQSLKGFIEYLGEPCQISRDIFTIGVSEKVILPGVGSFREAMYNLHRYGLVPVLEQLVKDNRPVLGICLGMQVLTCSSTEGGFTSGLGMIDGALDVFALDPQLPGQKIPHVGFNEIFPVKTSILFKGLPEKPDFYFTHSYRLQCPDDRLVSSYAENGERFVASIEKGNLFGTQFHPELSQDNGIQLMKNFIQIS